MDNTLDNLGNFLRSHQETQSEPAHREREFREFCNVSVLPVFAELKRTFESAGKWVDISAPGEGESQLAASLIVHGANEPDFEYTVWARIVSLRALVMQRYTELNVDQFPPVQKILRGQSKTCLCPTLLRS